MSRKLAEPPPHLEPRDVRDHVGQQCVAGNVERHPEAHVARALVQLARQLTVAHVELAQSVAGGQSHARDVCMGEPQEIKKNIQF